MLKNNNITRIKLAGCSSNGRHCTSNDILAEQRCVEEAPYSLQKKGSFFIGWLRLDHSVLFSTLPALQRFSTLFSIFSTLPALKRFSTLSLLCKSTAFGRHRLAGSHEASSSAEKLNFTS